MRIRFGKLKSRFTLDSYTYYVYDMAYGTRLHVNVLSVVRMVESRCDLIDREINVSSLWSTRNT